MPNSQDVNDGKIAVILGGSGFIGTHLCRRLSREGGVRIFSIDIRPPRKEIEHVTYVQGDVRSLGDLLSVDKVDVIYNLAAVHTTPGHPSHEYYQTNVQGALEATALAERHGCDTIVFTSSISVYGPSEDTKMEATKPAPETAYGWSKWLAESIHRTWLERKPERRLVIARPAVIFGEGEGGNFTRLAKLMKKGFFVYPGRKDTIKACYYVEDLIDSILAAERLEQRYLLFNGAYADRYTLEQIVEAFRATAFPRARTFMVPKAVMLMAARILRPLSPMGLGIHPERILKLLRSTDVVPTALTDLGMEKSNGLHAALKKWADATSGEFR